MPRSPTVLTPPPGTLPFVPNTTIESGKANAVWLDLYQDGNTPRPIVYGGTGASNAADALSNLGGVGQGNFLAAFSIGDGFYSARDISSVDGTWLRRNGALYNSADYPELAALLPSLPDGIEWSSRNTGATSIRAFFANSNGLYIGSTGTTNSSIHFSTNGEEWAQVASIADFSVAGITQGGSIFVAVDGSGYVSVSNNGISWTARTLVASGQGFLAVAYGAGLFVAVGTAGIIYTSPDGASWTSRTSGVSTILNGVSFINSTFVAVGSSGVILTSTDGISWTARTSGAPSAFLYSSAYGAGVYVVVGAGGVILSSTNLSTWTSRTSGTSLDLQSVTCSSSGFLAAGSSGVARISSNGTTWSASATGVSISFTVSGFDPDNPAEYYVGGSSTLLKGIRTLPTQFRVPNDAATYGWIKAEND